MGTCGDAGGHVILSRVRRWWRQHLLRGKRIPAHQRQWCVLQLPVLPHLSWQDLLRMGEFASLFLRHEPT